MSTEQDVPSPEVVDNPLVRFKNEYPFTFAVILFELVLLAVAALLARPAEEIPGPIQSAELTNIVAGLLGAWVALVAILVVAFWAGIFAWRAVSD